MSFFGWPGSAPPPPPSDVLWEGTSASGSEISTVVGSSSGNNHLGSFPAWQHDAEEEEEDRGRHFSDSLLMQRCAADTAAFLAATMPPPSRLEGGSSGGLLHSAPWFDFQASAPTGSDAAAAAAAAAAVAAAAVAVSASPSSSFAAAAAAAASGASFAPSSAPTRASAHALLPPLHPRHRVQHQELPHSLEWQQARQLERRRLARLEERQELIWGKRNKPHPLHALRADGEEGPGGHSGGLNHYGGGSDHDADDDVDCERERRLFSAPAALGGSPDGIGDSGEEAAEEEVCRNTRQNSLQARRHSGQLQSLEAAEAVGLLLAGEAAAHAFFSGEPDEASDDDIFALARRRCSFDNGGGGGWSELAAAAAAAAAGAASGSDAELSGGPAGQLKALAEEAASLPAAAMAPPAVVSPREQARRRQRRQQQQEERRQQIQDAQEDEDDEEEEDEGEREAPKPAPRRRPARKQQQQEQPRPLPRSLPQEKAAAADAQKLEEPEADGPQVPPIPRLRRRQAAARVQRMQDGSSSPGMIRYGEPYSEATSRFQKPGHSNFFLFDEVFDYHTLSVYPARLRQVAEQLSSGRRRDFRTTASKYEVIDGTFFTYNLGRHGHGHIGARGGGSGGGEGISRPPRASVKILPRRDEIEDILSRYHHTTHAGITKARHQLGKTYKIEDFDRIYSDAKRRCQTCAQTLAGTDED